jgi:hypothetical protein
VLEAAEAGEGMANEPANIAKIVHIEKTKLRFMILLHEYDRCDITFPHARQGTQPVNGRTPPLATTTCTNNDLDINSFHLHLDTLPASRNRPEPALVIS